MKPTKEKTMEAIYLQSSLQFGETLKSVSDSDYRRLRDNYDALLKQPLQLGFFVPCDENGNVLDPSDAFRSCEKGFVYSKAKEKVLFELNSPVAVETMNYHIYRNRNIEYLANFGSLELTPTAIKQIGL